MTEDPNQARWWLRSLIAPIVGVGGGFIIFLAFPPRSSCDWFGPGFLPALVVGAVGLISSLVCTILSVRKKENRAWAAVICAIIIGVMAVVFGYRAIFPDYSNPPSRERLSQAWIGGNFPVILKLSSADGYLIAPGKDGKIDSFRISNWSIKEHALLIRFDKNDLNRFAVNTRGFAGEFQITLFLKSDSFWSKDYEIELLPFYRVGAEIEECLKKYKEEEANPEGCSHAKP